MRRLHARPARRQAYPSPHFFTTSSIAFDTIRHTTSQLGCPHRGLFPIRVADAPKEKCHAKERSAFAIPGFRLISEGPSAWHARCNRVTIDQAGPGDTPRFPRRPAIDCWKTGTGFLPAFFLTGKRPVPRVIACFSTERRASCVGGDRSRGAAVGDDGCSWSWGCWE